MNESNQVNAEDNAFGNVTVHLYMLSLEENKWITSKYILTSKYDAAQVKWGGDWRMPTKDEFSKLKEQCDWSFVTSNGVSGCIIRGKGIYASNSVFLPCVGKGYEERQDLQDSCLMK